MMPLVFGSRLACAEGVMACRGTEPRIPTQVGAIEWGSAMLTIAFRFTPDAIPLGFRRFTSLFRENWIRSTLLPYGAHTILELLRHLVSLRSPTRPMPTLVIMRHMARTTHRQTIVGIKPQVGSPRLGDQMTCVKTAVQFSAFLASSSCASYHSKPPRPKHLSVGGVGLNWDNVRIVHADYLTFSLERR